MNGLDSSVVAHDVMSKALCRPSDGSRHASWKCIRRLGFKYGLPELLRRIAWCRPAYRWMANDVSNLTVHCSPLGVKDMFVSMAMKMSRPEPSCGHGPDKTSANTV